MGVSSGALLGGVLGVLVQQANKLILHHPNQVCMKYLRVRVLHAKCFRSELQLKHPADGFSFGRSEPNISSWFFSLLTRSRSDATLDRPPLPHSVLRLKRTNATKFRLPWTQKKTLRFRSLPESCWLVFQALALAVYFNNMPEPISCIF